MKTKKKKKEKVGMCNGADNAVLDSKFAPAFQPTHALHYAGPRSETVVQWYRLSLSYELNLFHRDERAHRDCFRTYTVIF